MCGVFSEVLQVFKFPCIFHSASCIFLSGLHMLTCDSMNIHHGNEYIQCCLLYVLLQGTLKKETLVKKKKKHADTMKTSKIQ